MYLNNRIKAAKIGYIMISILLCVLGIVLIAVPDFSVTLLCRLGGGIMVLFGLVKIVGYCSKDLYRLAFQFDLAFGLLLVALGVILIIRTDAMVNLICIVMGICVLADALLKIQISIDSKAFGIQKWWLILAVAILTGAAGFLLVLRPSESAQVVMILLGVTLITEGVLNLITILTAVKIIRHQLPEVILAAETGVDLKVVDGVILVRAVGGKNRRQVDAVEAERSYVVQILRHAPQRSAELRCTGPPVGQVFDAALAGDAAARAGKAVWEDLIYHSLPPPVRHGVHVLAADVVEVVV